MAAPWEKYQTQKPAAPWEKYAAPQASTNSRAVDQTTVALDGLVNGIPVAGPILKRVGDNITAAGFNAYDSAKARLTGDQSQNFTHAEHLAALRGERDRRNAEYPTTKIASEVTGGTLATLPLATTNLGAQALGVTGKNLLQRSAFGALSGGTIGYADSLARGNDAEQAAQDARLPTIFGGAIPVVGAATGALARGAKQLPSVFNAERAGLNRVAKGLAESGLDDAAIRQQAQKLGPEAMVLDMGERPLYQAGGLANMPGKSQSILRNALDTRAAGANARLAQAADDTMGAAQIPQYVDDQIRDAQRALSPRYQEAFANSKRVDTQSIADDLAALAVETRGSTQKAVNKALDMLRVAGTDQLDPDPRTLFQVRNELDDMISSAMRNEQNNTARILTRVRQQVDDTLAQSVPGIKDVDAQFAELARQRDALQEGQKVFANTQTAARPQQLADRVAQASEGERLMLRTGARAEIDRLLGNNANDVAKLNQLIKSEGDWNRSRLATLFGEEKADQLIRVLDAEKAFAQNRNLITGNSLTANRLAAQAEFPNTAAKAGRGFRNSSLTGVLMEGAMRGADRLTGGAVNAYRQGANIATARALTSPIDENNPVFKALMQKMGEAKTTGAQSEAARKIAQYLLTSLTAGTSPQRSAPAPVLPNGIARY